MNFTFFFLTQMYPSLKSFSSWSRVAQWKKIHLQCRELNPWVGKIPWRRKRQPISVFLPGESHGQRSLVATVHRVYKGLDTTEQLNTHTYVNRHNLPSSLLQATILDFPSLSSWKFLGLIPLI